MKKLKAYSASLVSAVLEIAVGLLLIVNPAGFTSGIVIGLGVLLIIFGLLSIAQYFMSSPLDAAQHQGLSRGLMLLLFGALCALWSDRIVAVFPLLTVLYGVLLLMMSAAKVQVFVDMLRLRRENWGYAAVSAGVSLLLSVLVLINPFETTAVVFTLIGVTLLAEAVLDVLSVFMKKRPAA